MIVSGVLEQEMHEQSALFPEDENAARFGNV
jgi:hypothetical protein